jgi:hypothetical protein
MKWRVSGGLSSSCVLLRPRNRLTRRQRTRRQKVDRREGPRGQERKRSQQEERQELPERVVSSGYRGKLIEGRTEMVKLGNRSP